MASPGSGSNAQPPEVGAATHFNRGLTLMQEGRKDEAIREMEAAAALAPDSFGVEHVLGDLYLQRGDTGKAAEVLRRSVERHPESADAHYYYALALAWQRKTDAAATQFDQTIRLDPGMKRAYISVYNILAGAGQKERGLRYLERWSAAHPEDQELKKGLDSERRKLK
ncbi:MAG: tetratricopeptide repeat protein [Candidatus Kerfeldbacteria bacterium]